MDGFISFAKSLRPTPRDLAEADQELGPVDSTDIHDTPAARYRFAQFLAACRFSTRLSRSPARRRTDKKKASERFNARRPRLPTDQWRLRDGTYTKAQRATSPRAIMRAPPAPQDERWRAVEAALAGLPTPPDVRSRFDAIRDCKLTAREYARLLRGGVDVIRQTLRDPTDRQAFENLVPELLAEAAALDRFGGRPKALPRDRLLVFWHQKLGASWEIATPDGNPPRGAVIDYLIAAVRYVSGDVIGPEAAKKIVRAHKAIRFPNTTAPVAGAFATTVGEDGVYVIGPDGIRK